MGDCGGQEAPADGATKKVRAMMARATRGMMETSPREGGDNGHNNQLSTKVEAAVRTVVGIYGRQCKMDGSGDQDGQWRQDQDGRWQRQWAMAAQLAAERQNYPDGQSGGNGRRCKMDGRSDYDGRRQQDCNGGWQRQLMDGKSATTDAIRSNPVDSTQESAVRYGGEE
jgi:hypothetical protein